MSSDLTSIQSQFNLNSAKSSFESIYEFENFRLDGEHLMLYRDEEIISLAPKVIETLLALVERRGEIVSKREMMNRLWAESFVEESNLTQNIYLLRKTLGKGADGRDLIETFRRRGYRFTGKIKSKADVISDSDAPGFVFEDSFDTPREFVEKKHRSRRKFWYFAAAFGVLLLVVLGLRQFGWRERSAAQINRPPNISLKRLTPDINAVSSAISPDGKYLVYTQKQDDKHSVWLKDIATGGAKQILPTNSTEGYGAARFSPDGKQIYYTTSRKGVPNGVIMRIPFEGGTPQEIAQNVISPITISPDGNFIAFMRDKSLILADANGATGERILKTRDFSKGWFESWNSQLSFSPDGARIAVCGGRIENGRPQFKLTEISIADGAERDIPVPKWNYLDSVQWIPDGSGLMVIARETSGSPFRIWRVAYPSGEASRITQNFSDYKSISIAADSRQIVAMQEIGNRNIWVVPTDDFTKAKQITSGAAANDGFHGVATMPDGRIVFTSPRGGSDDIWIMSPDGANQKQLTSNAGANIRPAVSPDGRFIYFQSDRGDSVWRVWRIDADGANPQQMTNGEGFDEKPVPSPDGNWIYFTRQTGDASIIMKISASGGEPVRVTTKDFFGVSDVSPDGKTLLIQRYDENASVAWQTGLMNAETGEITRMFAEQVSERIRFSSDGKSVFYLDAKNYQNLWQLALDGNDPRRLTNFESGQIRNFDLSADGKTLVLSRGNLSYEAVLITDF